MRQQKKMTLIRISSRKKTRSKPKVGVKIRLIRRFRELWMSLCSSVHNLVPFNFYLYSVDTDEMLHFIRDLTVCKSTRLGVSRIQRVNLIVLIFNTCTQYSIKTIRFCYDLGILFQ